MTRFATLRQTDTAAPFAALGPRLAAPEAAAPDRLGVYLETLQILDRLHRLMLDLIKDEFERLRHEDLTPVQALLLFDLGGELCIPGHAAIDDADVERRTQENAWRGELLATLAPSVPVAVKVTCAPSLRPIQLRCIALTLSGQSTRSRSSARRSA